MSNRKTILVPVEEMEKQAKMMGEVKAIARRPHSYHIITYGCQMNAHDSEKIAGMFQAMGIEQAETKESADLILFNTCCIRDNAERKALGNMAWLKQLKAKKPDMILCVCGCMMQQPKMAEIILKQYPFFDVAFGTHNLHQLPELLLRAIETKKQVIEIMATEEGTIAEGVAMRRESPYKAYITIMYGCNNFCSYCIVPYVRGRERSREPAAILAEAEQLMASGVKEITLLGQNVNSYGNDTAGMLSFPALLKALDALGVPRLRFMTSHPKDLSDELIDVMATSRSIAKHFHLPVQSGSTRILAKMNRGYTAEHYVQRVAALREAIPGIALTTDLIVGFPGETEADFQETLDLVRVVRYDSAYTFIYSPREGTRAARFDDMVPEAIASERIGRLITLQDNVAKDIFEGLIGSEELVLVEEQSRRNPNQYAGKAGRSITCNFEANADDIGQFIPVEITGAGKNTLKARRL